MKNYESFEVSNMNNMNKSRASIKSFLYTRIIILSFLIIAFEIIYLICVNSVLKDKNNQLLEINFKKYLLTEGNEKLYELLNEDLLSKYSLNDEITKMDNEIKKKEDIIKECKQMSADLLHNYSPTPETLVKTEENNKKKKLKINELKKVLKNSTFSQQYNTKIIDSINEFNTIEFLIYRRRRNLNDIKLCYRGENNEINYSEAYKKCDLNKDIPFLIIFQTNVYERYGVYISTEKENFSFIFSFNSEKVKRSKFIELNNTQKQSLIYIINIIKEIKFEKQNKNKDDMKDFIITDLEIFSL